MWQVLLDGRCVKEYPFKVQAVIYCYMHGWVYSGWDDWEFRSRGKIVCLDPRVQIIEKERVNNG